jgi:transcriptional regulator with XRE-family HTH domain
LSQRALAAELGWSQSELNRLEQFRFLSVPLPRLSAMAAVLGRDLSAELYLAGEAVHDTGQQALIGRLASVVAIPPYVFIREVLLPHVGDPRSWDALLRLAAFRIGVEAETRIRDIQALVRKVRQRERDGGVDRILIVLSDSRHNRALVNEFREALGPGFAIPPRQLLGALRAGRPIPGSGVILL